MILYEYIFNQNIQSMVSKPLEPCWVDIGTQPFLVAWVYLAIQPVIEFK